MSDQPQSLPAKVSRGKATLYTPELAQTICDRMATGEPLRQICRDPGMPAAPTVIGWAAEDREGFAEQYARARELQCHAMAEEILEIADETASDTVKGVDGLERPNSEWISRSRLRVDSRKWLLSKMLPKVYGDKVTQEITGKDGQPLEVVTYRLPENDR